MNKCKYFWGGIVLQNRNIMRTRVGFIVRILVALAVVAVVSCKQAEPQVVGLTVEYVETPLGVDT